MKLFPSIFLSLLLPLAVAAQSVQIQDGAIRAEFSVSDSTTVYFSQGNLQYQASTNTWRFAEHQWDYVLAYYRNSSFKNDFWIDLFGWGTSCYNGKNPYMTSTNQAGMWRTLTKSEWNYLISGRAQANRLMGQGRVNNVNGLILLPDSWATETPSSVRFTYAPGNYSTNVYSLDEWAVMESYGAVFLPAAGYRYGTHVDGVGSVGDYWSSSASDNDNADFLGFSSYYVDMSDSNRYYGLSVRLVQDVK